MGTWPRKIQTKRQKSCSETWQTNPRRLYVGQVVGSTTSKGEEPQTRPVTPNDFLATLYHAMGVPLDTQFRDFAGRPIPIVPNGSPISELF